jgi:elongation factor P
MKEGDIVTIVFHADEERPLTAELPPFVNLEITYTEPGVKGDTATNATKPATVETGAELRVPLFINEGDKIRVDTRKRAYVERIKE